MVCVFFVYLKQHIAFLTNYYLKFIFRFNYFRVKTMNHIIVFWKLQTLFTHNLKKTKSDNQKLTYNS